MLKLHGVPDWGSQVIHMALAELQVPFSFEAVDWQAGGLGSPEFLALNPFGRVPVLETPEGPMFETAAILLYLSETNDALAPKPKSPDRGAFLTWFTLVTNSVHPMAMTLLHPERPGGEACAAEIAETAYVQMQEHLALLNGVAQSGVWWLSPDRPSILSLYLVMLMRWIKGFPAYARHSIAASDYPALFAMAAGLETRPAIAGVLQKEGISGPAFSNPPCETVDA